MEHRPREYSINPRNEVAGLVEPFGQM
jgi:hypothetical protein